jgi:hypothetical protein
MTNGRDVHKCIADFKSLRWQRATVFIGDAPSADHCTYLEKAVVDECRPCFTYILFTDGRLFDIATQTIKGKKVYLFRTWGLHGLARRIKGTTEFEKRRQLLSPQELIAVAGWVAEMAGEPDLDVKWLPNAVIDDYLGNVSVPDIELLVSLMPSPAPSPSVAVSAGAVPVMS